MVIYRFSEMDRPTHHSLQYLTTVRPHYIHRDPWLVDPFVYESVSELIGKDPVEEFGAYTRSYYTLEGHYANLWNFDRPLLKRPNDPLILDAIEHVREIYRLPKKVDTIPWHQLHLVPFISQSSAGWGFHGKKGDPGNHEKAIHRAVGNLHAWIRDRKSFRFQPDIAWTRSQLCSYDNLKLRHVWGTSFDNIILEGITAGPLIEAYRNWHKSPMIIGRQLYKRLPDIINSALFDLDENEKMYGIGLDLKSFDSTCYPWMIDAMFDIVETNLNFTGYMEYQSWLYTKHFFKIRPIVMPDGRLWLKRMGVPSGSYYTQLGDSVINSLVCAYVQLRLYGRTFKTSVLGDDSLFGIPHSYGVPDLSKFSTEFSNIGMILSDKSTIASRAQDLSFLGHVARGSRIDRDSAELLRIALYPDYEVRDPSISLARLSGLLLDSALNNWPILHLYNYMKSKYRHVLEKIPDWSTYDKNWLKSVVDITIKPKEFNEIEVFSMT